MSTREMLKQPNLITTALYSLSRNQKRVFYVVIQSLTAGNFKRVASGFEYEIGYEAYAQLFDCDNAPREIRAALTEFTDSKNSSNSITFSIPENDSDGAQGDVTHMIVTSKGNNPKSRKSTIVINPDVHDILSEKDTKFTLFLIANVSKLVNVYSMRVYELISQWRKTRTSLTLEKEWIMTQFYLPPSYRISNNFRSKFISRVVEEINEKTDLTISCEELCKGERKNTITHIKISWESKIKRSPIEALRFKGSIDDAFKTYDELRDKVTIPSLAELDNYKKYMWDLNEVGMPVTPEIINNLNEAVLSYK